MGSGSELRMAPAKACRLIVNADDFGLSAEVNEAVVSAHERGILTSASLMVRGAAAAEAVALARAHPGLAVGLHLTLVDGWPVLPPAQIPGLVDEQGRLSSRPVQAGWRYFWRRDLQSQLRAEMEAQLGAFKETGLPLDHLNGHLHLHLHPAVLPLLLSLGNSHHIRHVRLTRDPLWFQVRLAWGRWFYRGTHALIFGWLAARARPLLRRQGIGHAQAVFGLLQHGRVTEAYVSRLLRRLPRGSFELYAHPSTGAFRHELEALVSPRVRRLIEERGIELIRYRDL